MGYPVPEREEQRLQEVEAYRVMDTPPESEFDHIAQLAASVFHAPTALISFVGSDRQFFKAKVGFDACETSRDVSFCTHALVKDELLIVPDAQKDHRFKQNPLVIGAPFIRFYAGAPLRTGSGYSIGSLCIIDYNSRSMLSPHEQDLLRSLARITMDHLERRRLGALKSAALNMAAATPDAIVCTDANGLISFWNRAAESMFGFSRAEAIGGPIAIIAPRDRRRSQAALWAKVLDGNNDSPGSSQGERIAVRKDGARFPVDVSMAAWKNDGAVQVGCIIRDVTERNAARERVRILTYFDRLTGLPNRVCFLERIEQALQESQKFTVLKIGLDKFKAINGSRGIAAGDLVLQESARRLADISSTSCFLARLGSDEFGLLRLGSDDPIEAETLAGSVLAVLGVPFDIQGSQCHLSASVGLALCRSSAQFEHADAVLKGALLALQHAKWRGGRRSELFRPDLGRQAEETQRVNEELREAWKSGQFVLYFQPQVQLLDGTLTGAEALLRWNHPERGILAPGAFMAVLEKSAVALDVGQWILHEACAFAEAQAANGVPIRIGVNLFAIQLEDANFYDRVVQVLEATGIAPDLLELEITETTVLGVDDLVIQPLRRLRSLGVKIAFDDYGTGFASLSLLKRYPLTRLKIDRQFVRELGIDAGDAAIVKAVVALGQSLNLEVIAEGVETLEQAKSLVELGCREAQGYLFGKPTPGVQFQALYSRVGTNCAA